MTDFIINASADDLQTREQMLLGLTKRKLRDDLTPQELFRLEEYGSIHFESAGARRQK